MKKLLLVLLVTASLAACDDASDNIQETSSYMGGAVGKMAAAGMAAPMREMASDMAVAAAPAPEAPPSSMVMDRSKLGDRKIAETHNLSIETSFDTLQARYQRDYNKCVELGCQITNSYITKEEGGSISARIAPESLGKFLDSLAEGEGKIKNHQVSADDMTMEYSDTVAQTENLMALRERLRNLLNSPKADEVDAILRIESELNRVQTEIDQRTARLKILQKMTSMATVYISYSVEYRPAEIQRYELKNTWKNTLNNFLRAVDTVIRFVGGVLPWVPVCFVGFWLVIRAVRFAFGKTLSGFRWPWRKY